MKKTRCLELKTADGRVLLVLNLTEKETALEDAEPVENKNDAKPEKPKGNAVQNSESTMTDAQKRYLFRILAERGIEGDKAYAYLKETFQVDALKEVTKLEASRMIEQLLNQGNGGKNGIPF